MAIKTTGLCKSYQQINVVNNISLHVPKGEIFGLLGPNGAGKTTFMRLLLGLIRPSAGSVQIFGKNITKDRIVILKNVGALIEKPAYYEHLSGCENLKISAALYGIKDSTRVDEVMEQVGLVKSKHKKVKAYSLGMKQRLGIANAMLHKPRLLLLDEPTNGLDPEGKLEILQLIEQLVQTEGVTVLISSHLLSEIEKLSTQIGVIYNGELLYHGTKEELLLHDETLEQAYINLIRACKETG